MRNALSTLTALLFLCAAAFGQGPQKKDEKPGDDPKKAPEVNEVGGRKLNEWIADISSKDPSKREHAMRMVLGFGPAKAQKAVPAILAELKKHNKPAPIDLSVRINGAVALGTILSAVEKPDTKHLEEAVTILKGFTKDPQVIVRTRAVQSLAQLAPRSEKVQDALDDIIRVCADTETWQARQAGIEALLVLTLVKSATSKEAPPPRVVNAFHKALGDNSMQVRTVAVQSMAQLKHLGNAEDARRVKALEAIATRDPEPSLHLLGELALMTAKEKIGTEHLAPVIKMLHNADPAVRIQAAQSLGLIGRSKIPDPKDPTDPKKAVHALVGKERKHIKDELIAGLDDSDINVAAACIGALFQMEPDDSIQPIAQMLNHKEPARRAQAAQVLAALGTKAKAANGVEELLILRLADNNNGVVVHCINALAQMVSLNAVPALQNLAMDPKQEEFIKTAANDAIKIIMDKAKEDKKGKAPAKTTP
jgi:HEAT repeat protein